MNDWTGAQLERLRELWAAGYSTRAIGEHFGLSKNSIVGKVHYLGLPGRPSPIVRRSGPPAPRPQRTGPTLPPLASARTRERPARGTRKAGTSEIIGATLPPMPPATVVPVERAQVETAPCCWPIGARKPFRFCGAPAEQGKPYCPKHCRDAYVITTAVASGPIPVEDWPYATRPRPGGRNYVRGARRK